MTRTLAFAGILAPRPAFPLDPAEPAIDLDPWSATALQVALVIADQVECLQQDDPYKFALAENIWYVRDTIGLDDIYGDDEIAQAYRAVLTRP